MPQEWMKLFLSDALDGLLAMSVFHACSLAVITRYPKLHIVYHFYRIGGLLDSNELGTYVPVTETFDPIESSADTLQIFFVCIRIPLLNNKNASQ